VQCSAVHSALQCNVDCIVQCCVLCSALCSAVFCALHCAVCAMHSAVCAMHSAVCAVRSLCNAQYTCKQCSEQCIHKTSQKLRKRNCTALYAEWYLSQFLHYNGMLSFCIVQCTVCTALYSTALFCTEHCSALYNAVCTALCSVCALHCSALSMRINAVQCSVQCSVVQCSVLCSAVHCSVSARLPDHTHITRIHTLTFKETGCQPVPAPVDPPTPPEAFCTLARRRTRTHTHSLTT
jgi:hypothetical protein